MIVLIFRTFQSTHPRGVRHRRVAEQTYTNYFNPRTHVGCDPLIFTIVLYISNFNPRTHVGCDGSKYGSPQGVGISIHAPTWGATYRIAFNKTLLEFQSTHPRGVRLDSQFVTLQRRYFNPRTHVGCDIVGSQVVRATRISIHAPTWGATSGARSSLITGLFQSTHPRGVRPWTPARALDYLNFNPRTHVGCDFRIYRTIYLHTYFNPRTHVGCD